MKRVLNAVLLLMMACGDDPPAPPPPTPGDPEPALPELPDLKVAGLADLDTEKLIELPARDASELRWNFSGEVRHVYDISVNGVVLSSVTYQGTASRDARLKQKGRVELVGGKAFYKTQITACTIDGVAFTGEELNKQPPVKLEYRIREDGKMLDAKLLSGSNESLSIELLFRLPRKALAAGESESGTIETTAAGFRQEATFTTQLTGYRKVERYECARLVTDVEIKMTPEKGSTGRGLTRGRVVAYFAPVERRYVRVEAAFSLVQHTKNRFSEPGQPDRWTLGSLWSDVTYRLNLVD